VCFQCGTSCTIPWVLLPRQRRSHSPPTNVTDCSKHDVVCRLWPPDGAYYWQWSACNIMGSCNQVKLVAAGSVGGSQPMAVVRDAVGEETTKQANVPTRPHPSRTRTQHSAPWLTRLAATSCKTGCRPEERRKHA